MCKKYFNTSCHFIKWMVKSMNFFLSSLVVANKWMRQKKKPKMGINKYEINWLASGLHQAPYEVGLWTRQMSKSLCDASGNRVTLPPKSYSYIFVSWISKKMVQKVPNYLKAKKEYKNHKSTFYEELLLDF